jgi:nicotinate-nucleotide pyrophosphorylase (carboxylating)
VAFELTDMEMELIRMALKEDLGSGDITSEATIPAHLDGAGFIRAKEPLVLAGLPYAKAVFKAIDPNIEFAESSMDGDRLNAGDVAARVSGNLRFLLAGERLALNLLQRLSGVATLTARFARQISDSPARITDTRKTTPLWRRAEKFAVRAGGGVNHRMGLYDAILIKDNHIDANESAAMAVMKARRGCRGDVPIIVEIRTPEEVEPVLAAGATRLLLDNMSPEQLAQCVKIVSRRAITEASGSVTLEKVRAIAATGVDYISIGALTHSPAAADLNFKIKIVHDPKFPVEAKEASGRTAR